MPISPVIWQFWEKWLTNFGLLPPEASTVAVQMDALFWVLVLISVVGTAIVVALVVFFSIRYSKENHPVADDIEGSTVLEVTWTLVPLVLFMLCFVWGALLYFRIYNPPANAMNIYVVGKQWMWKSEHPGGQHEINALHVPMGVPVQLTLISQDVFHSFSVPAFRVKREAIPGRYTSVWFQATKTGTYDLFCTQYCGTAHSAMIGYVTVMSPDDYKAWAAGSTSGMSLAQNGERLFASMQCNACHNGTAGARGPSLAGVYGTKLSLANGSDAYVDEAFLRQAILSPSQHVTAGYAPIMPTYQGQISEDGLIDLVEYIKTLHNNDRPQQTLTNTTPSSDLQGAASVVAGAGKVKQ
jgi:cytochrome c oxidase subunit 2